MNEEKKVWKIRFVKNYSGAHNHLFIGEVLDMAPTHIKVKGRTYHWGKAICNERDMRIGDNEVRIIPWARIEIINELPANFNYSEAKLSMDNKGMVVLVDENYACKISSTLDDTSY